VPRTELKETIARLLKIMTKQPANTDSPVSPKPDSDSKAA
jgi:acetyl-CoA carboxylase carboxyl transferase subunit beta